MDMYSFLKFVMFVTLIEKILNKKLFLQWSFFLKKTWVAQSFIFMVEPFEIITTDFHFLQVYIMM